MDNLALKYRPSKFEEVVGQTNVVKILKAMCEQEDLPNRNFLLVGPRGCGKAQPLDSRILTPHGYVFMRDIQVGDEVFTAEGNIAKVCELYPQGVRDIYEITLDDNSYIRVSDNHLNEVWIYDTETKEPENCTINTLSLKTLFDKVKEFDPFHRYFGVNAPVVDWEASAIPETLSKEVISVILEKFEPAFFLNSIDVRIKFLKMLIENSFDMSLEEFLANPTVYIDQKYSNISNSFQFLIQSLGCKDTITFKMVHQDGAYLPKFQHFITFSSEVGKRLFGEAFDSYDGNIRRYINSIQYVGQQECQCILLDHEDHTYISDNFIPTHNTTLGRIMANTLNEGLGSPIELDAASNNGVDTVRELVTQAHQYPIGSKYKVFICDECHMFSQASWASMLKVLEEQPAKSVFILLTTNPEKITEAILSRVQKFQLSTLSLEQICSRMKYVIEREKSEGREISYTEDALEYIAKLAKGGMRDALTLLDKVLVYDSEITQENLRHSLDIPDYDEYFKLLNFYARKSNKDIMQLISNVYNSGKNFVKWFEGFQSFVIHIAVYVFTKDISKTMIPIYYKDKLENYNEKHAQICLTLSQLLIDLISKISKTEYMEEIAISYLCQRR